MSCWVGLVFLLVALPRLVADDWPQWRGPNRDGIWRESGILETFPAGGPAIRWRAAVGAGYSGPSVALGRVYLTDRVMAKGESAPADAFERGLVRGQERVLCLDAADGKLLWQHAYDCHYTISYPAGPRVAPLVHEGRVYTLGAEGNLYCFDAAMGTVAWSLDLKKNYQLKTPVWGYAAHPLIDGPRLICLAGGRGSVAVCLDKDTGKELWRALSAEEPGYSSPVIYQAGGQRQLIIWHPEAANSLNPETGALYWSVPWQSKAGLSVATPGRLDDLLFLTTFYNGSLMLRLDAAKPEATPIWRTRKVSETSTTHLNAILSTPFLEDGHLYGVCSYGQLRCLKASTGERLWETFEATTSGAPARWANAFIVKQAARFVLFNEKGDLIFARLSPVGYTELSRAHLLDPTNKDCGRLVVWSHPAFANRCVYARNDRELVCADLSEDRRGPSAGR